MIEVPHSMKWPHVRAAVAAIMAVAALVLLGACDDQSASAPPTEPAVELTRTALDDLACTGMCGFRLTYEARTVDSNEPAEVTLNLSGDGSYPRKLRTDETGQVTFYWEFPRPQQTGTSYALSICPTVGRCAHLSATIHLPPTG